MNNTIIVTGVNGFVGRHMARNLHEYDINVIGVGRESTVEANLGSFLSDYVACDLTNEEQVKTLVPYLGEATAVINLAGIATTNNDPDTNARILKDNVLVHELLYEAMLDAGASCRAIAVATGLSYAADQEMPLVESSALQSDATDTNVYVRSKLRAEKAAQKYRDKGLDIITARPFNHTGQGQPLRFFVPDQIEKIKNAMATGKTIELGDGLDFWRDFLHVEDVIEAYRLLATIPHDSLKSDVYNVASGEPLFGRNLFRLIAKLMNFTNFSLTDSTESHSPKIYGSSDLLTNHTGWQKRHSIEQAIGEQL